MPFLQGRRVLIKVVSATWNQAVDTARNRRSVTGVSDQKDRLVTLDDRFRSGSGAEQRLALFETSDELLSISAG